MVNDRAVESEEATDHTAQLDTTRGSTVKLKRFEEVLIKSKLGKLFD